MKKVTIDSVREHPETKQYVVILKDENEKQLVIWIGQPEAWAIAGGLNEIEPPRPMSAFNTTVNKEPLSSPERD